MVITMESLVKDYGRKSNAALQEEARVIAPAALPVESGAVPSAPSGTQDYAAIRTLQAERRESQPLQADYPAIQVLQAERRESQPPQAYNSLHSTMSTGGFGPKGGDHGDDDRRGSTHRYRRSADERSAW